MPDLKRHAVGLLVVILAAVAVYANSMGAPFQWDEAVFLEQNPVVYSGARKIDETPLERSM